LEGIVSEHLVSLNPRLQWRCSNFCFTDELAARDADRAGILIILGTPEAAGRVMFIG
jgi:hypothetical protein